MVELEEITGRNYRQCCSLKVSEKQINNRSVASNVAILARAYAYRKQGGCAYAISNAQEMVGLLMYRNLDDPPACYILDQFMIDARFQGRGYGKAALMLLAEKLRGEKKYAKIELGCSRDNTAAMKFYQRCGFYFSGDDSEDEIGMAFDL